MKQRLSVQKKEISVSSRDKHHNRTLTLQSNVDSIVMDQLNSSTVKFHDAQQVKSKVYEIESNFQSRQKCFEKEKEKKISQLKQEQLNHQKEISNGKPKINKTQQIQEMISNYMEASIHSKFGDLLLKQNKNIQTQQSIKLKKSKFELAETSNYENNDPQGVSTQTTKNPAQQCEELNNPKIAIPYIPIHERVKFIVETKNSKIVERQQKKDKEEEDYYLSLPFRPLSTKSQNLKLTQKDADDFASNQIKWIKQRDKKIFEQQLKQQNETPKYSYRPAISPWPKKPSSPKRVHSKSFISSFFQSKVHTKTESSPNQILNQSLIFHTDIRIAKRKEKEQQKQKKWM